jgi:hypothetical protein
MDMTHATTRNANTVTDISAMPSTPELLRVYEEVEAIKRESTQLVSGLSDEALTWRLAPDKWSIADCLVHLNITNRDYYVKPIRDTIADARVRGLTGAPPYRHGFFGNLFVRMIEPPVRFRVPAPRALVPPAKSNPREVVAEFMQAQNELNCCSARQTALISVKRKSHRRLTGV